MPEPSKRFLVTSALPYANGPLHFGHLAGVYIPADIYARHRRLQGHEVLHISGSDEHGVAIMVAAEKEGMPYQEYVDRWHVRHQELFKKYDVEFDFFGRTSAPYHAVEVLRWFKLLHEREFIGRHTERQLYSIDDGKFLPDRYVEGTCYVCGYANARGDECPNCGEWIEPTRLIEPRSKMSGSRRIEIRDAEQYYLLLTKLEPVFREWWATKTHWRNHVTGAINSLLDNGLIDRAITRDLTWGIDVPLPDAQGKKLYVWFDAPIGYVSNLKQYLQSKGSKQHYLSDWWQAGEVEINHFIGKDNIIFHALIWPCMILGTGFTQLPSELPASHFVNLEGRQFSKSMGWYVDADAAINEFGVEALRLYLCSLIPEAGDSTFSWDGFALLHAEVGNKIGNFVHRTLTFVERSWPQGLPAECFAMLEDHPKLSVICRHQKKVLAALDRCEFHRAFVELMSLGQSANEFLHAAAPWKQLKTDVEAAEQALAIAVVYIAIVGILLRPFVPTLSAAVLSHFDGLLSDGDLQRIYRGDLSALIARLKSGYRSPVPARVLLPRLDPSKIDAWRRSLQETAAAAS